MKLPDWLELPKDESWNALMEVGSNSRSLFRVTENAPEQIAPGFKGDKGLWSSDPRFHALLREASETMAALAPVDVDDTSGFAGPTAIIADFGSLRNLAGHFMSPISVPLMNNEALAQPDALDLLGGFASEREGKIFTALHHYMFRTIVPAPMAIRKAASSGAPYFESSLTGKKEALAVFNEHSPTILNRFAKGELGSLYYDFGLFFSSYMGVRTQPDAVRLQADGSWLPKPREVNDELFARTAGKSGSRFNADKRVFDRDGNLIEGLFAMRRRSVYAYPAMYNYWLTQFMAPLRAHYQADAEFTFKHRDPVSIAEKLTQFKFVRGYDVKQFDQSVQPWLLDSFVDRFTGFIKDEVLFFLAKVLCQPIYVPHPAVANASGAQSELHKFNPCFGDPFDLSTFTNHVGLPSGIGPNPDIGKFVMTFAYLCLFDRHFHDVLETGIPTILRGQHNRYALLDMGDDAVLATNDESLWDTIDREMKGSFYFRLEKEEGISFLGNVLYRDKDDRLKATSNVVTFVRNRLCPEHGTQHWSRRNFCGSGWFEGMKHYSTAPMFNAVIGEWDRLWQKHFKESKDIRFFAAQQEEKARNVPVLSDIDRAVLENPDKIFYRYDISEIHPWVLDQLVGAVEFDTYFPFIEKYFK